MCEGTLMKAEICWTWYGNGNKDG